MISMYFIFRCLASSILIKYKMFNGEAILVWSKPLRLLIVITVHVEYYTHQDLRIENIATTRNAVFHLKSIKKFTIPGTKSSSLY
jgi:hypothetical protein